MVYVENIFITPKQTPYPLPWLSIAPTQHPRPYPQSAAGLCGPACSGVKITQPVAFTTAPSLHLMSSRFIHVVAHVGASFLLIRQILSHCMDSPHFISPCISWWVLGLFLFLGFYEQCCSEHGRVRFRKDVCFPFLDINLGVELQGREITPCLTFLRKCQTVFQSSCTVYIPSDATWGL